MSEADRTQRREDVARPAARILAQGRRVPGRRLDAQERGARQGAALPRSGRSRPTRMRRGSTSCWATACCSQSSRSISRPPCWPCCRASLPRFRRARRSRRPAAPAKPTGTTNSPLILSHGMCAGARGFQPGRVGGAFRPGAAGRPGHAGSRMWRLWRSAAPGSLQLPRANRATGVSSRRPGQRRRAGAGGCAGCPVAALIDREPATRFRAHRDAAASGARGRAGHSPDRGGGGRRARPRLGDGGCRSP